MVISQTMVEERFAGQVQRPCLDCSACCEHFEIEEISKASGQACPLARNGACGVYGDPSRPRVCQRYVCAWAMGYGRPSDRPDKSGVIVDLREGLGGRGLYGHLTREPNARSLRTLERISEESGLDVYLEQK